MHTIHLHRYLTATVYAHGECGFAQVSVAASLTRQNRDGYVDLIGVDPVTHSTLAT